MAEHLETQAPVRVSRIDIDEARAAVEALGEINIPAELRDHLALFVRLERKVLREYDEDICNIFDKLLASVIAANEGNPGEEAAGDPTNEQGIPTTQSATADAFRDAIELIDSLSTAPRSSSVPSPRSSIWRTSPRKTTASRPCASARAACPSIPRSTRSTNSPSPTAR